MFRTRFSTLFRNSDGELRNGWWIALFFLLLAAGVLLTLARQRCGLKHRSCQGLLFFRCRNAGELR